MNCLKCRCDIGNKKLERYGLHETCFSEWFSVPATAEFVSLQRMPSSKTSASDVSSPENSSFFQGKFKKYSAELNNHAYILKVRENNAPELPEVEYLCNQIAKSLGIPVAEFYYIYFNEDYVFATKNFIKSDGPSGLLHIKHFRSNDQHSCEGLIETVLKTTQQPRDVKILIQTILFDSLIGNHDRHGRNLGFVTVLQHNTLSPIYDNVSYLSLEKGNMLKADFNPTGKISTKKTNQPSMKDYVIELIRLGYENETRDFHHQIKLDFIAKLIEESFCSELMKNALKKLIEKRYGELAHALSIKA